MNWYILFSITKKPDKLLRWFNAKEEVNAFIPKIEYYRRDISGLATKPLFPNYIFVQSTLNQKDFDLILIELIKEKNQIIKQLKYQDVSALRKEEIHMLEKLLNKDFILEMSYANLDSMNKAIVYEGPLRYFEKNIIKVDKHNQVAYLNIRFLDKLMQAGLVIKAKYEI